MAHDDAEQHVRQRIEREALESETRLPAQVSVTLLAVRREQLRVALEELFERVADVRACHERGLHDLPQRLYHAAEVMDRAVLHAHRVDDLAAVEKYGPTGGR